MKNSLPLPYLFSIIWISLAFFSCRETPKAVTTPSPPEVAVQEALAPEYKEIGAFMDLALTDSTRVDEVFNFKAVFNQDSLADSEAAENLKLYKGIMRNGRSKAFPIFESKTSDLSLVVLTGRGFVGSIWAELLFDRQSRKIVKVRFGHQMETEGYGSGMTEAVFEEQFAGGEIRFDTPNFVLKGPNEAPDGASPVDGISGATATSSAVLQMLNSGLKGLEPYFTP